MRRYLALLPLLLLCSCKPPEESHMKAILGAVLLDGDGGPPVSNSVVVTAGSEIRAAGASSNIPIPAEADKIDGSGRYLVPALVDICPQKNPPEMVRATPAEAWSANLSAKAHLYYLAPSAPSFVQKVLEGARESGTPVIGFASTEAEMQTLVTQGAAGIIGMIGDTDDPAPALLARMRDLRVVVAPAITSLPAGAGLERARRNTRRFFAAGIRLAVASNGGDPLSEAEALSAAGIPPLDVLVAATLNGAIALHQAEHEGTIRPGGRANMILLSANPGEDIGNLRRVAGRMTAGEWASR